MERAKPRPTGHSYQVRAFSRDSAEGQAVCQGVATTIARVRR
ncbi:hypothetical protein SC1_01801 [Sphingopyxis sp. C-1]|nr:hypothetical protein SC1_01801 [Sphingopyxis sp. C-1]